MRNAIKFLLESYDNAKWVSSHKYIFDQIILNKLTLCGSLGRYIMTQDYKEPNDFDLIAPDSETALKFIFGLQKFLLTKEFSFSRILTQNKTKFCLSTVDHHFRLESSIWKPICVFVLKEEHKYWYYHGMRIQFLDSNLKAKEELDKRREKKLVDDIQAKKAMVEMIKDFCHVNPVGETPLKVSLDSFLDISVVGDSMDDNESGFLTGTKGFVINNEKSLSKDYLV